MEWWLLTFFLGAILSLFIPIVPEISLLYVILAFSLLLFHVKKTRLFASFLLGSCWVLIAGSQYQNRLADNSALQDLLDKKTLILRGTVATIVHQQSNSNRFNFIVSHWQGNKLNRPFIVRLNWKAPTIKLLQGQQWQLVVKLKPAHGLANIGGFNYQVWLKHQRIVATGYVKSDKSKNIESVSKPNNFLISGDASWRQQLYQKLDVMLAGKPLGPLLLALGFGERGKLTDEHWKVLSATATVHLIAISGLHIGIVALFSLVIARSILKILPLANILLHQQSIKLMQVNISYLPILFSCFMAWYYAYLAGYSIPTLRALVMLFTFWLLKISAINVSLTRWLLLTILVILLCWPLSLLSASFWLSISALSIIFATSARFLNKVNLPDELNDEASDEKQQLDTEYKLNNVSVLSHWQTLKWRFYNWCKGLFIIQLALTVCMLPIAASLNYQLPLLAFFANIIAVPLMSVTTIPLTLLAVIALPTNLALSKFFLTLAHLSLEFIWRWLQYISEINWAQVSVSNTQLELVYLIIIGTFFILYFRLNKFYSVLLTCFMLIVISSEFINRNYDDTWQVSVLDVGHGLAVIIEKNHRVFVYDTGAHYPSGFNMAEAAILPYLKYQGYQSIDGVIISHNDNDHAGGLDYLRNETVIHNLIANDMVLAADRLCLANTEFTWQSLRFEILSPSQASGNKNDDSCVVVVSDDFHRVLLPGDISSKQEKRLLANAQVRKNLASDILIAPHHGSKSSSNRLFLAAVSPRYAAFSTGYLNRWKMPSEQISKRYQKQNITTFNTAELGMVTFTLTPSSIEPSSFRQNIKPYWFVN